MSFPNLSRKILKSITLGWRSADAPDVPLVTMEYSLKSKKILQCYANSNTKPADDITTYINTKWLPYAKRQLKKIAA